MPPTSAAAVENPPQISRSNQWAYQRAYKACIPCRNRKSKCVLSDRNGPPCVRCRRMMKECVFDAERAWSKKRRLNPDSPRNPSSAGHHLASPSSTEQEHDTVDSTVRPVSHHEERGNLETPDEGPSPAPHGVPDLVDSVVRTVVSNGNDALNLLFQAATRERDSTIASPMTTTSPRRTRDNLTNATTTHEPTAPQVAFTPPSAAAPVALSNLSPDILRLWSCTRFVKMGWLSAAEAVTLVDAFYCNLAPLSPAAISDFADHATHHQLLTLEPLLCSTILMISSRHHILQNPGGVSRAYFLHDRCWKHCQHLIMRLMFGQEKGSRAKTRTLGSVEALLMICEWHARALHYPPEHDGWDSDLLLTHTDEHDPTEPKESPSQWLEDLVEPVRRSDRMSWMLLGCANSLAHELRVFEDVESDREPGRTRQKHRLRKLIFVFFNQFEFRVGHNSVLHQNFQVGRDYNSSNDTGTRSDEVLVHWMELTKLLKTLFGMLFSSRDFAQDILHSGRYVGIIDHFQPLLSQWHDKVLSGQGVQDSFQDMLFIEYQYARIYCNSIGIQAVCERTFASGSATISAVLGSTCSTDTVDEKYIEEVICGSCDLLEKVIQMAQRDALRFAPVRIFLRTATASMFLLKTLAIGVRHGQLRSSMDVLGRTVHALRSNVLDDVHLANRYAGLLETHIDRLRHAFVASSKRPGPERPWQGASVNLPEIHRMPENINSNHHRPYTLAHDVPDVGEFDALAASLENDPTQDWLMLPFDPTMAPLFPCGDSAPTPNFNEEDRLSFLWNIPA